MSFVEDGMKEFGLFFYDGNLVYGHCIWSSKFNCTTIFSFNDKASSENFIRHFDDEIFVNGSQVIFFGSFQEILDQVPCDLIQYVSFSRGGVC